MNLPYARDALRGRVAVVAGATRGAGRGIAAALGEAGATVVCTGRTSSVRKLKSDYDRTETIEETAELVTQLGGKGIAVPMDHLVPDEVKQLADRLQNEFGKIDILVNDIWGAEVLKGGPAEWNTPVWKHDLAKGLRILRLAIDTHIITSKYLLPLLIAQPGGLLIEVTDGTTKYNASHYRISVYYDLAKVAVNRLAYSQGHELAPYGATAVAITPGCQRTGDPLHERLLVTEGEHRLEQKHRIEPTGRKRRDLRHHEAAGEAASPLSRDVDGARTRVDAEVAAVELSGQEPSRPGDSAAHVEDGSAGNNAGALGEGPDLARAHETLLLDVLSGSVSRLTRVLQRLDERTSLVLRHAQRNRRTRSSVLHSGWSKAKRR